MVVVVDLALETPNSILGGQAGRTGRFFLESPFMKFDLKNFTQKGLTSALPALCHLLMALPADRSSSGTRCSGKSESPAP